MSTESEPELIAFEELCGRTVREIGGKAFGLARLRSIGRIPKGFLIVWRRRTFDMSLPAETILRVEAKLSGLRRERVREFIIRSSSPFEDIQGSNPGRFTTIGPRSSNRAVLSGIAAVAQDMARKSKLRSPERSSPIAVSDHAPICVIVQEFVRCRAGGVIVSMDSQANSDFGLIEASIRGPAGVTEGDALTGIDRVSFYRPFPMASFDSTCFTQTGLTERTFQELTNCALQAEVSMHGVVEAEWGATSEDNTTVFFQLRPGARFEREDGLVVDVSRSLSPSPKVVAVRKQMDFDDTFPRMRLVSHVAFQSYVDANRRMPSPVKDELVHEFSKIINRGDLAIRPAAWGPAYHFDALPQTGPIKDAASGVQALERYWDFVLTHWSDFSTQPPARVEAIVGPWLSVKASAIVEYERSRNVSIQSRLGMPEGMENQVCDLHVVEPSTGQVLKTRGAEEAVSGASGLAEERPARPEPALTNEQAVAIAQRSADVCSNLKRARVEFLIVKGLQPVLWQLNEISAVARTGTYSALFSDVEAKNSHVEIAGDALIVRDERDIPRGGGRRYAMVWIQVPGVWRDAMQAVRIAKELKQVTDNVIVSGATQSHFALTLSKELRVYAVRRPAPEDVQYFEWLGLTEEE